MNTEILIQILLTIATVLICVFAFVMCKVGRFPKFMPNYFKKVIDQNTPRYYDLKGNLIDPKTKEPLNKEQPKPNYDFQADTTATITMKGIKAIEEEIKPPIQEEVPEEVLEQATPSIIPETEKKEEKKEYGGFCSKCRTKRIMINHEILTIQTKRGLKTYAKGKCSICNAIIMRLIKI